MIDFKDLYGIEIFLGYSCNVKCKFCYQKDLRFSYKSNMSKNKVISLINENFAKGGRFIIFSGGEPTLDVNLVEYISYAKKLGYIHIRIHTNGILLSNNTYLNKLYNKGLSGVTLSIHGFKNVHDNITKVPGSFLLVNKALININKIQLKDKYFVLDTNTVLFKENLNSFLHLFLFLFKFNISRRQINLVASLDLFSESEIIQLIPKYSDFIPILEKIVFLSIKRKKTILLDGIPLCSIKKIFWGNITSNIQVDRLNITLKETIKLYKDTTFVIKPEKICGKCSVREKCKGIPLSYYNLYGYKPLYKIK